MLLSNFNRLIVNLKTEGICNTLIGISRLGCQRIGIISSNTLIYKKCLGLDEPYDNLGAQRAHIRLEIFRGERELKAFGQATPKLANLPLRKWFKRGSVCLALTSSDQIFGYGWIHFAFFDGIDSVNTLRLDANEAYIGPFFIDPKFRGNRLYYALTGAVLNHLKSVGCVHNVYTASSIRNLATIKVMISSGFNVVGLVRTSGRKQVLIELTRERILEKKLTNEKN